MKKYIKNKEDYESIEFDEKKIKASMKRLKDERKIPISVALKKETVEALKKLAKKKGVPYQVLMRMFILEGLEKTEKAA